MTPTEQRAQDQLLAHCGKLHAANERTLESLSRAVINDHFKLTISPEYFETPTMRAFIDDLQRRTFYMGAAAALTMDISGDIADASADSKFTADSTSVS